MHHTPWSTKVDHGRPRSATVDHGRPKPTQVDQGRPRPKASRGGGGRGGGEGAPRMPQTPQTRPSREGSTWGATREAGERWGRIHRNPAQLGTGTVTDGETSGGQTSDPKMDNRLHATGADDRTDRRPWYHAATGADQGLPQRTVEDPRLSHPVRPTAHGRERALSWAQLRPNENPKP